MGLLELSGFGTGSNTNAFHQGSTVSPPPGGPGGNPLEPQSRKPFVVSSRHGTVVNENSSVTILTVPPVRPQPKKGKQSVIMFVGLQATPPDRR